MLHGYGSSILDGAWLTINLALTSMAMAIALGLIGAAFRLSPGWRCSVKRTPH